MEFGRPCREISKAAAQVLLRHTWPGNVRELRNVIRRAILLASDVIEPEHLSFLRMDPSPTTAPREESARVGASLKEIAESAAADAEQQAIHQVLQVTRGNKSEAARLLRTDYKTLHLKMKQYGIDAARFRELRASRLVRRKRAYRLRLIHHLSATSPASLWSLRQRARANTSPSSPEVAGCLRSYTLVGPRAARVSSHGGKATKRGAPLLEGDRRRGRRRGGATGDPLSPSRHAGEQE